MSSECVEQAGAGERQVGYVALDAGAEGFAELPGRVLIAPWGRVESVAGSFVVDEEAVGATLDAFAAHGTEVPIDYEHQTLGGAYQSPNGQAPAAGWIKRLMAVRPGEGEEATTAGLWAEVTWTPQAREQLATRQYRYLSPVAVVRGSDGRMIGLHSAALTNKPAIAGMRPVVNGAGRVPVEESEPVGLVALRAALSLDAEQGEAEVLACAAARIRALQTALDARRAAERVGAALAAGKLTAAQQGWATGLARDPGAFDEWLATAPVVVAAGRVAPPVNGENARAALERRARAEFRAGGAALAGLCSEEAFVADALRGA